MIFKLGMPVKWNMQKGCMSKPSRLDDASVGEGKRSGGNISKGEPVEIHSSILVSAVVDKLNVQRPPLRICLD